MGTCISTSQKHKIRLKTMQIQPHDMKLQQIKNSFINKSQLQAENAIVQRISNQLEQEQLYFANLVMKTHYLFKEFKQQQRKSFAKKLYKGKIGKGGYVFRQNQKGDKFYIIFEGKVEIQINNIVVTSLQEGDSFGQLALMYYSGRAASVRSIQNTTMFLMDAKHFKCILKDINLDNAEKIKAIISKVELFSFLTQKQKSSIVKHLVRIPFKKGQKIFQKDEPSNCFYIIQRGEVKISIPGNDQILLHQYQSFGQNCFSPFQKRAGSAYCNSDDTFLLMLGQKQIQRSLGENVQKIIFYSIHKWALTRSKHFDMFSSKEIQIISCLFTTRWSSGDQLLMQEGFHPDAVIVCLQGTINGQPKGSIFCDDYYGKKHRILNNDIIKDNPGLFSFLSFKSITNIWKQLQYPRAKKRINIKDTLSTKLSRMLTVKVEEKTISIRNSKVFENFASIEHLQIIKQIQKTDCKSVWIARDQILDTDLYTVKIFDKSKVIQKNMQDCVLNEKKILQTIVNPYTIEQSRAFIDTKHIFFVSKYHNGVSLDYIIQDLGFLNIFAIQAIIAFLVVIFQGFQNQNIIYRNLKPQKIFVNSKGKVCITDFSSSKIVTENQLYRTYTILGTPHYMAPQMLQGRGYTTSVDYWSLGILIYYLIYAIYPFGENVEDPIQIYKRIKSTSLQFPETENDKILRSVKSLIKQLLQTQPHKRIPGKDFQIFKKHTFFEDVDFQELSSFSLDLQQANFKIAENYHNYRRMPGKNLLAEVNYQQRYGMQHAKDNGIQLWNDYLI